MLDRQLESWITPIVGKDVGTWDPPVWWSGDQNGIAIPGRRKSALGPIEAAHMPSGPAVLLSGLFFKEGLTQFYKGPGTRMSNLLFFSWWQGVRGMNIHPWERKKIQGCIWWQGARGNGWEVHTAIWMDFETGAQWEKEWDNHLHTLKIHHTKQQSIFCKSVYPPLPLKKTH